MTGVSPREANRLFTGPIAFVKSAPTMDDLPPANLPEVAFAGRSNVGKSSLLNALTARKGLARTSNTPGRTQLLNIFDVGEPAVLRLVDMPGYGYAEAPKPKGEAWTRLIHSYLRGRANLARVYVLIDARHGIKDTDMPTLDALGEAAVSHQIVLTKADQLGAAQLAERVTATAAAMAKRPAAFPELLVTSARKGTGIPDLRAAIAKLVAEGKRARP